MGRAIGDKVNWQQIMRLVCSQSIDVPALGVGIANTVTVEFDDQDDTNDPRNLGHAHYTISAIVRNPAVTTYINGAGTTGVIFDPDGVQCALFRKFIPAGTATPDDPGANKGVRWRAGLAITNFTNHNITVIVQAYRLLGLV